MSEYTETSDRKGVSCAQEEDKDVTNHKKIESSRIDLNALWVIRRLRSKGHEAYLTGGCVRDLLRGKMPKDFDIATSAKPPQIKACFGNCRLVGRRFLLAHVFFPGGCIVETATFRAAPDPAGKDLLVRRDNVYGTLKEDALRRDLTINGLFYDPIEEELIDFVGGWQDLQDGVIRSIGDPSVRMQEDPVRMIRAVKFAQRMGFSIEDKTLQAIRAHAPDIVRCAPARLQEELLGLLRSGQAQPCFAQCFELGLLDALAPELTEVMRTLGETRNDAAEENETKEDKTAEAQEAAETDKTDEIGGASVSSEQLQQQWNSILGALDAVCHKGARVESAVAIAAFLLPVYLALHRSNQNERNWLDRLCVNWARRLRLVRHDQDLIRLLLSCMVNALLKEDTTPAAMKSFARKPWFRQALLLYTVHLQATAQSFDTVKKWKEVAHQEGLGYIQPRKTHVKAKARWEKVQNTNL